MNKQVRSKTDSRKLISNGIECTFLMIISLRIQLFRSIACHFFINFLSTPCCSICYLSDKRFV